MVTLRTVQSAELLRLCWSNTVAVDAGQLHEIAELAEQIRVGGRPR